MAEAVLAGGAGGGPWVLKILSGCILETSLGATGWGLVGTVWEVGAGWSFVEGGGVFTAAKRWGGLPSI